MTLSSERTMLLQDVGPLGVAGRWGCLSTSVLVPGNLHGAGCCSRPLCSGRRRFLPCRVPRWLLPGGSPAPWRMSCLFLPTASVEPAPSSPVGNLFLWRFCWLLPLYQQAGSAFHLETIFILKKICLKQDSGFKEEKSKMLMI